MYIETSVLSRKITSPGAAEVRIADAVKTLARVGVTIHRNRSDYIVLHQQTGASRYCATLHEAYETGLDLIESYS